MKEYYESLAELKADMVKENVSKVVATKAVVVDHTAGWVTKEIFQVVKEE